MLDHHSGDQALKGSAKLPLSGLDELKGRLMRLQESPAFGDGIVERTPQPFGNHSTDQSIVSGSHQIHPANLYQDTPNKSLAHLHTSQDTPSTSLLLSQPRKTAEALLHDNREDGFASDSDVLHSMDRNGVSNDVASAERMRALENRLKVTQEMYDQMVNENDRVLRDKERIENEVEKLQSSLKNQQGATAANSPDVVYAQGSVFARKEVDVMQQQLKVTCQEIITLRKSAASKEEECKSLAERHEKESTRLRAELFQAETDLAKMRAEHSSGSSLKVHELTLKAHELSEDLKRANRAVQDLEKSKAGLEEESRSAAEKIMQMGEAQTEMGSEIARLKNVIIEQEQDKLELQKALALKDELIAQKELQYSDLEETLQSVESELEDAKEIIADLQTKNESLQAEVAELEAVVEDLKEKGEVDQKTILDLARSNQDLTNQNQKLAVDIPQRMQTHIDKLQKDTLEAKVIRDKQVKRLEKKLEKRETEIAHLRQVWRSLLTSHPEIDQAAEAAVDELRELSKTNKQLEAQINELQEQNEGLTMNYAITYIRLMLANWRRPLYLKRLKKSLSELAEEEARLEAEEEQREAGGGSQGYFAGHPQTTTALDDGTGAPPTPPMTAFSTAVAKVPVTSSAYAGDTHQGGSDHASASEDGGDDFERPTNMDPVRYKALQEGRAKYHNAFQKRYATDGTAQEEDDAAGSAASEGEERVSRTPDVSPGKEQGGDVSRSESTPRVDIDWAVVQSKIPPLPPSRSSSVSSSQVSPPDMPRPGVFDAGGESGSRRRRQDEVDAAVKTQIGAVEELEKLRANADTVREWAQEEMVKREQGHRSLPSENPTSPTSQLESLAQPTFQSRPTQPLQRLHAISPVPLQSTPHGQMPTALVCGKWSLNTPPPPDTGMLEELSIGSSQSKLKATVSASVPAAHHHLPSSASSKPLTGPPRSGEGVPRKGGGWPEVSPGVDLSKWVMDWLSPSQDELVQRQKPRDQLTRQNLYPEDAADSPKTPSASTAAAAQQGSC
mmetsp:Transcript_63025/g.130982  ORF Transcript_63025/g.130982 Transcript_63025/m.130982 type:complete len:1015 (+) Transcript_63025:401-3445(+)|eukprot:CAMPEP_0181295398 /NCGR_PEP_ID=MMETSP1101-20121128/4128_1 /TAXON_ID=46948 /ORGANISM="Rhodomonas abbreviata, Strain Caron Lab Isolate" /LENGTH=1014 /DNA_ID=CAMNT_0023400151 /DNA_START=401 /DNA_END=3445 /DNA_ORIENTATION=+